MPIRILHVIDTLLGMGGMEKGVVNLIQRMDPARFEHVVCVIRSLGSLADSIPSTKIVCLGETGCGFRFLISSLARQIKALEPDIVHSRNWGTIEAVLASRWNRSCAVVHSEHGIESLSQREPWWRPGLRRVAFQLADQVLTVSYSLRDLHARRTGFPAHKIAVIHNGVDTNRFFPRKEARGHTRQRLGVAPEEFCIGVVGRLEPVKDILTLLRAASELPDSCRNWRIVIAGDGSEMLDLRAFVGSRSDLRDRLNFLGEIQDIPGFLNALDVYVLPSLYEGISNSLLEAMASGLPVIASAVGGNTEVVVDGESGILFPAGESSILAECLKTLYEGSEGRQRLGREAIHRVQEHFSLDSMVQAYERMYTNVRTS